MDDFNCFVQAWVGKVEILVQDEVVVLKANVRHSQSISSPLLHPCEAATKNVTVICAHFTCMADLGEACSHTTVLLFHAETNSQMKKDISCTSAPCSWLPPGCKKVEYAPISDIDFRTHRKTSIVEASSSSSSTTDSASSGILSPTDDELARFYNDLLGSSTKSAILSIILTIVL